jgi:hypothetical protein
MLFSWYSGDYCTDPAFADLAPEQRANPSMSSWPDGVAYLLQQRTRLPTARYRRLHLNLPGAPQGAAFDQAKILSCVVTGRRSLPPEEGRRYYAFTDLSGGSSDDSTLCIAHREDRVVVIDCIEKQAGSPPLNPRDAVKKFAGILKSYGIASVTGDAFAGQTFRCEFEQHGITYKPCDRSKSEMYEFLEPVLNAGEVELLDHPTLTEQLVCLVWRGSRIDHEANAHDDFANALAGVSRLVRRHSADAVLSYDPVTIIPRRDFGLVDALANPTLGDAAAVAASGTFVCPANHSPWDTDPAFRELGGGGGAGISLVHLGIR